MVVALRGDKNQQGERNGRHFDAATAWCRSRPTLAVEARLELGVSRTLLERVIGMPFRVLLAKTGGEVLQSFDGLSVARELLATRAAAAVFDLVSAAAFVVLMFVVAPGGAVIVCGGGIAAALVSVVFARIQRGYQQQETDASVAQRNAVIEVLRSIARVKAAAAEGRFLERWSALLGRQLSAGVRRERASVWPEATAVLVRDGVAAAILIWGALRARDSGVTVGSLVAFVQLATVMLASVGRLADAWSAAVAAAPQLAAARDVLALPPPSAPPRRARTAAARLMLDDVTFRYRRDLPDVVRNASMTVEAGELRRIEGPSGSGKSTLLRLMAGILEPDRGSVRVTGDVMYLPQFARLFSGTLAEISPSSQRERRSPASGALPTRSASAISCSPCPPATTRCCTRAAPASPRDSASSSCSPRPPLPSGAFCSWTSRWRTWIPPHSSASSPRARSRARRSSTPRTRRPGNAG